MSGKDSERRGKDWAYDLGRAVFKCCPRRWQPFSVMLRNLTCYCQGWAMRTGGNRPPKSVTWGWRAGLFLEGWCLVPIVVADEAFRLWWLSVPPFSLASSSILGHPFAGIRTHSLEWGLKADNSVGHPWDIIISILLHGEPWLTQWGPDKLCLAKVQSIFPWL